MEYTQLLVSRRRRCERSGRLLAFSACVVAATVCIFSGTRFSSNVRGSLAKQKLHIANAGCVVSNVPGQKGVFQHSRSVATKGFFDAFDSGMDAFMTGWKNDKWNPDRRTEEDKKIRSRPSISSLSWGRMDWSGDAQEELEDFLQGRSYPIRIATNVIDEVYDVDVEITDSLRKRMKTKGENRYMCGRKLAEMVYAKYGKYHDVSLLQAKPFGSDYRQVAFNIYGPHLGSPSFPYSEDQYLAKLDELSHKLNTWDQAWYVQEFLESAIKPRRGLPSRPRADTAVTLRLNQSPTWYLVPDENVSEVFSW
uniref:Uncharacterized protein n=1 Tax=Lotharella globosa TaxID=91324 RepID=A0A6U3D251_9EUKA|mmetsp:Transcript_7807/g.15244  ORF Transcript_7807/g.15244 Transcript_7807/m.15244 type:complete len:308 (+) Transcript_7807:28-951(+)